MTHASLQDFKGHESYMRLLLIKTDCNWFVGENPAHECLNDTVIITSFIHAALDHLYTLLGKRKDELKCKQKIDVKVILITLSLCGHFLLNTSQKNN